MEIKARRIHEKAELPARAHANDAGADLTVCLGDYREFMDLAPGETRKVPTHLAVQIPAGFVGIITSRSSARVRGLAIAGVVDAGYTGALHLIVTNATNETKRVTTGERIAQLIVHPVVTPTFVEVDELDDTERGANGFGSTGRTAGNGG